MNSSELVTEISKKTGFTKTDSQAALNAAVDTIKNEVRHGRPIRIAGFGVFKQVERKARDARNPHTGEAISVPARKVPKFSPGKEFKEETNTTKRGRG